MAGAGAAGRGAGADVDAARRAGAGAGRRAGARLERYGVEGKFVSSMKGDIVECVPSKRQLRVHDSSLARSTNQTLAVMND